MKTFVNQKRKIRDESCWLSSKSRKKKWIAISAYFSPMKFCNASSGNRVAYSMVHNYHEHTPIMLVHGFCEDQSVWSPLLVRLETKSLILIDLPGFGASDLPSVQDMTAYSEAILGVLDAEKIEQCILIGHSMGGYAALEFASKWPERLAGLGLFHSHPFEDSEERKTARLRGIDTLKSGKRDLYVSQLFPNLFAPKFLKQNPDTLDELISNGKRQSPEGISAALQAMLTRRDHQQTLSAAKCPVLFILGAQDTLVAGARSL